MEKSNNTQLGNSLKGQMDLFDFIEKPEEQPIEKPKIFMGSLCT